MSRLSRCVGAVPRTARKKAHYMKKVITKDREETIKLGERIAKTLNPGDVIALIGELGSGKTTFVKGIAKGLGVKGYRYVNSPSFVIIKEYRGRALLYHFDVFRLDVNGREQARGFAARRACLFPTDVLSFEEYFYGGGICVVEWADKIRKLLPKKYIEVKIEILSENKREIDISRIQTDVSGFKRIFIRMHPH